MVNVYIPEQSFDQNVHDQYFDNAKAGTLDVLGATFEETLYYNPVNALGRIGEQYLGKGRQGRTLTKEEYVDSEYYREGFSVNDDGISEGMAQLLADRHDEREAFKTTLSRSRGGFGLGAAQFGVALAGSLLDPLNIASAFIPSVAAARGATLASKITSPVQVARTSLAGRTTGSRFATGTMDGAIGAAVVEPLVFGAAALEQDDDYTLMDSFLNIALGAGLGGSLHAGFGKISDRINKLPQETKDTLHRTSVAQVAQDQEVKLDLITDNVEKTNIATVEERAGKKIVYRSDGTTVAVDVVDISKDGTITVRDVDGTEKILDASDLRAKSPFDEDYEVDDAAVSSMTEAELKTQIANLEANLQTARESNDAVLLEKLTTDRKAIEVEMDRRAGKTIERPANPDLKKELADDIASFQKEIDSIRAKAEKRKNKNITAKEQAKLKELQEKIATRQTQLQEASDLVETEQGVLTEQQKQDLIESQQLQPDNLGRLSEHKEAVEEMAADNPSVEEIDLNEFEAENARLQEDLQNEEVQAVLPPDIKQSIDETAVIDEKASKFEEISRAGAACILRR
tara:strand:+ start:7438 stop:9153 length:1716 start_codon:yes stop_codon:yes gene_type:complete